VNSTHKKTKKAELKQIKGSVELITQIAALCHADLAVDVAYQAILNVLRGVVRFDAATLFLMDRRRKQLVSVATLGGVVDVLEFLPLGYGHGLPGWVAEEDKPVLLQDRSHNSDFNPETDYASVACVPLKAGDEVTGVLNVGCRRPSGITDRDVAELSAVAGLVTLAIECIDGRDEMQRLQTMLKHPEAPVVTPVPGETDRKTAELLESTAAIHHEISDALAVIVGNAQCFLAEQSALSQKVVSRLRRIEEAALKISRANRRLPGFGLPDELDSSRTTHEPKCGRRTNPPGSSDDESK